MYTLRRRPVLLAMSTGRPMNSDLARALALAERTGNFEAAWRRFNMPGSWGNALRQWGVRKQEAARRASLVSRVKIINFNGGGGLYGMSDTGSSHAASRPPSPGGGGGFCPN